MASGLTGVGVPVLPFWLLIVRGVIILLSLGCLIAGAYYLSIINDYNGYYNSGAAGFLVFDAVFTWALIGSMLALEFFAQNAYYRIVYFVFLILGCIFWLAGWAWAASWAAAWSHISGDGKKLNAAMAAGAALGAFTWILFIVTTVFFALACAKEPHGESAPVPMQGGDVEAQKTGGEQYVQPTGGVAGAPVQQYPQQPYPQQEYAPQQYPQQPYPQQPQQQHPYPQQPTQPQQY